MSRPYRLPLIAASTIVGTTVASATWRFIDSGHGAGARQMATDEAILTLCGQGLSSPTLRLYSFAPPCLSIGRFQSAQSEVDAERCRQLGIEVIRRPSGGRAVLHDNDLAYSLIAPSGRGKLGAPPRETYALLAQALAEAMRSLGATEVAVSDSTLQGESPTGRVAASGACFQSLAPYDVSVNGRKVIGSAQTRRRGALLQHGSIRLSRSNHPLSQIMLLPPVEPQDGAEDIGLSELLGRRLEEDEMAEAIKSAFTRALGVELKSGALSREEEALVRRLTQERYNNDDWTWSR